MSGTIERNVGNLHNQTTGKLVGYRNPVTNATESLDADAIQALVSGGGNSTIDPTTWPMRLPVVAASPPTLTVGIASAATAIAGSVLVSAFDDSAFLFLGGPTKRNAAFLGDYRQMGVGYTNTSPSPTCAAFILDTADATGRFEVLNIGLGGASGNYRVAVFSEARGVWEYATAAESFTHPANGSVYLDMVTLGAAGRYRIRLEFNGGARFGGIRCGPTDSVTADAKPGKRWIIAGDSYTEPTIDATMGSYWNGFPQRLSYLTGYDVWSSGSGGTGYVNPGSGGRVKLRDRLQSDVLAFSPDGVIFAMGINDTAQDVATVRAEALACFQAAVAAQVPEIIVAGPFWPKGVESTVNTFWQYRDVIKSAAAEASASIIFIDFMEMAKPSWLSDGATFATTLIAATVAGNASADVADVPAYFKLANASFSQWYVKLGDTTSQIVRRVSNITAIAGGYRLTFTTTCGYVIASGKPAVVAGSAWVSGSGRSGTPVGDGSADRVIGQDGTHPTIMGHAAIAFAAAALIAEAV
jgi:lysophospholipase L1-like esterase